MIEEEKVNMIVAGTGHRPEKLGGYTIKAFEALIKIAEDWLKENDVSKVISGMALAQASLNLEIPLLCAIPFEGQERMWSKEHKKLHQDIISKASEVVYVSPKGYHPKKMQIRNEWMVDNCNVLLTMWDGTKGGTYNCLKYADNKRTKIINLYEKYNMAYIRPS